MKTRIAKFISDSGAASRRDAEKMIADGRVSVNGKVLDSPVFFVNGDEQVRLDGKLINAKTAGNTRLFMFNKPVNTITSRSDPNGRKTIYDHLPTDMQNLKYIGRLDYKTTGLLLMTDDGELARKVTLPASGVKRVYIAKLHPAKITDIKSAVARRALKDFLSPLSADDSVFDVLRNGALIDGVRYAPMEIEMLSRYPLTVQITLTEGKKNEIRIVFDYIGLPVAKLHRISYGNIQIGDLKPGEIKEIPFSSDLFFSK